MSGTTTNDQRWRRDVLEALHCVAKRRLTIAFTLCAAIGCGVAMHAKSDPFYRASSTFVLLPREKPIFDLTVQSSSVETAEDGAKRSAAATLTLPPNPDLYTTLIRSHEVAERVSQELRSAHDDERPVPSAAQIREGLSVSSTEEGVLKVAMQHDDPRTAAAIVNAIVRECEAASKSIERQLILQQSGFLGTAIERAEERLLESRARLDEFTNRFGVAEPLQTAARSASLIGTLDDAEARLEQDLERLRVHRTDADPAVASIVAELTTVRTQRDDARARFCGDLSESEFAAIQSEWLSLKQDVTLRQDLLMSMRARHDVFQIRADQPAGNIAVIRHASPPGSPAGPSLRKGLVVFTLLGLMGALALCVLADQMSRVLDDVELKAKFNEIRACFALPTIRHNKESHA